MKQNFTGMIVEEHPGRRTQWLQVFKAEGREFIGATGQEAISLMLRVNLPIVIIGETSERSQIELFFRQHRAGRVRCILVRPTLLDAAAFRNITEAKAWQIETMTKKQVVEYITSLPFPGGADSGPWMGDNQAGNDPSGWSRN